MIYSFNLYTYFIYVYIIRKWYYYGFCVVPDPPSNIKTNEITNTTINIQWDIPWIFNGVLKTFIINVEEISSVDMNTCCVNATPTEIIINEELPTYNHTVGKIQMYESFPKFLCSL